MCGVKWPHPASCHNRFHQEPLSVSAIVLAGPAAVAKPRRWVAYEPQAFISPSSRCWRSETRSQHVGSWRGPPFGFRFLCVSSQEEEEGALRGPL